MPAMIEKQDTHTPTGDAAGRKAGDSPWAALYARIQTVALRRADALAADAVDDEASFDRAARAIRALVGAAEIARRMKREDEKESTAHDETPEHPIAGRDA